MKTLIIIAATLCMTGCAAFQTDKQFDGIKAALSEVVARVGENGIGQFQGNVQGINPGVRVEAGMIYYGRAGYDGLAGALSAAGQGTLDRQLSPEERAALMRIANDTSLTAEARFQAIIELVQKGKP